MTHDDNGRRVGQAIAKAKKDHEILLQALENIRHITTGGSEGGPEQKLDDIDKLAAEAIRLVEGNEA